MPARYPRQDGARCHTAVNRDPTPCVPINLSTAPGVDSAGTAPRREDASARPALASGRRHPAPGTLSGPATLLGGGTVAVHDRLPRVSARGLALLVCGALVTLLVGLSAVHSAVPGDTFQVAPRAAAVHVIAAVAADPESAPPVSDLSAVLPALLLLAAAGLLARARRADEVPRGRGVPAAGCRDPPASMTR